MEHTKRIAGGLGHAGAYLAGVGKLVAGGVALLGLPAVGIVVLVVLVLSGGGFASSASRCGAGGFGDGDVGTSIMGAPTLSVEQMVAWYRAAGYADPASTIGVSTQELIELYVVLGETEGVRPEVALVQAVVETGGFTNRDSLVLNNFAGIGHCDTCAEGTRFGSVLEGVLAQVQLLKKVALGNDVAMVLGDHAPRWGGVQAVDLDGLTGNWATSPIYASTLASTLGRLLASAGEEPSQGSAGGCVVSGDVAFPLPVNSIVTEQWLTKPHHDHAASDIPVPAGTEVYSPVSGTVAAAPVGGDCGLGVTIQDADGNVWTLCHGSDGGDLVSVGDTVAAGQLVMHAGWTGHVIPAGSQGAHLHVQIRTAAGDLVCPQAWLDALWRGSAPPDPASLPTSGCTN